MSMHVSALATRPLSTTERAQDPGDPSGRAAQVEKAAHEFESLLVRQLLTAAHVGGGATKSGYADMAVDALATGIENGGGLGLARLIEQSLDKAEQGRPACAQPPGTISKDFPQGAVLPS